MNELNKLTALMRETDELAARVVRARDEGLLNPSRAGVALDKLADVAQDFQAMLTNARVRARARA